MVTARVVAWGLAVCALGVCGWWALPSASPEDPLDAVAGLSAAENVQPSTAQTLDVAAAEIDEAHGPAAPVARALYDHALAGRVEDWDGRPLPGAKVIVDAPEGRREARAGDDGAFRVSLRSDAPVVWRVTKNGYGLAMSDPESPRSGLRVRLEPLVKVEFEAVDRQGAPADTGSVLLFDAQEPGLHPHDLVSYRFRVGPLPVTAGRASAMVPTGRWVAVTSWGRSGRPQLTRFADLERLGIDSWQHLHLPARGPVTARVIMPPVTGVYGRVTLAGEPVVGAQVVLEQILPDSAGYPGNEGGPTFELETDADGVFRRRALTPWTYELTVRLADDAPPSWRETLEVEANVNREIDIALPERGVVATVLMQDATGVWVPAPDVRVAVVEQGDEDVDPQSSAQELGQLRSQATTDANGRALLPMNVAGVHLVTVSGNVNAPSYAQAAQRVDVQPRGLTTVELRVTPVVGLSVALAGVEDHGELRVVLSDRSGRAPDRELELGKAFGVGDSWLLPTSAGTYPVGEYALSVYDALGGLRLSRDIELTADGPDWLRVVLELDLDAEESP